MEFKNITFTLIKQPENQDSCTIIKLVKVAILFQVANGKKKFGPAITGFYD
jgi:hypothetical protein